MAEPIIAIGARHPDVETPTRGVPDRAPVLVLAATALAEISVAVTGRRVDVLAQLNTSWRVVDGPGQWVIEQRVSASTWRGRKFIRDRDHLLRRIGELCVRVDQDALALIRSWPSGYMRWKARELRASGSHGNGAPAAISASAVHPGTAHAENASGAAV